MSTLAEELRARKTVAIIKKAEEFAEKMKEEVVESAEKGYSAYRYRIIAELDGAHLYKNAEFIEKLNELMDGVKIILEKEERRNILTGGKYYVYSLLFSWKE